MAENCNKQQQLDNSVATYNLTDTMFPTRITNGTVSAIDNISIDISHIGKYIICPFIKGMSDHDTEIIRLQTIFTQNKLNEIKSYETLISTPLVTLRLNWAVRPGIMFLMKMMLITCLIIFISHI